MKPILLAMVSLFLTSGIWAQTVAPNSKVQLAFSANQLSAMTGEEIASLNFAADNLCAFEELKVENQAPVFALVTNNGKTVVLNKSELSTFNPLMYQLPQDEFAAQNLVIQCADGSKVLLVVHSKDMMKKREERARIKTSKATTK
jgi:hypothetical protein